MVEILEKPDRARGRPRKYESSAEKVRAFRMRKIDGGYTDIHMMVPSGYKTMLDRLCSENDMTQAEAICFLLDCYYDEEEDEGGR